MATKIPNMSNNDMVAVFDLLAKFGEEDTKISNMSSNDMEAVYDLLAKFVEKDEFVVAENNFVYFPGVLVDGKPAVLDTRFIFNQDSPPTNSQIKQECMYLVGKNARLGARSRYECGVCQQVATAKCRQCKIEYYCSTTCQKIDWVSHRAGCQAARSQRLNRCSRLKCDKDLKNYQSSIPCEHCSAVRYCSHKCLQKDKSHEKSGYCDLAKRKHEDPETRKLVEEMIGMSIEQLQENPQALQKLCNPKYFAKALKGKL